MYDFILLVNSNKLNIFPHAIGGRMCLLRYVGWRTMAIELRLLLHDGPPGTGTGDAGGDEGSVVVATRKSVAGSVSGRFCIAISVANTTGAGHSGLSG